MSIPACPDCGASLGKNAHKCRCGWVSASSSEGQRFVDCFFAPQCTKRAQISTDRYQQKKQFQNLCPDCEQRLHDERAERWCRDNGLHTTRQRIEHCRQMAKKMFAGVRFDGGRVERVPGEDDELAA